MKETAFRPIEVMRLTPKDFSLEQQIVTLNKPAKRSNPRQAKISDKLSARAKPPLRVSYAKVDEEPTEELCP